MKQYFVKTSAVMVGFKVEWKKPFSDGVKKHVTPDMYKHASDLALNWQIY